MKIAVFLLSLWAIAATKAGPVLKAAPAPITAPVTTANAPAAPAAPAKPPTGSAAPATPGAASAASTKPVVPPADLVASKYKVSFKLANVKYDEGLLSYDSALYQNYAGKIEKALMNLYADNDAYREMSMIGFRNESGVVADVSLRFGNESKNLVTLDALIKTGTLGDLPVDPASLTAAKDESVPPMAAGFGCGQPCGAPQQCYPSCSSSCCGGGSSFGQSPMIGQQQYGAPMPLMGGMPMTGSQMPFPPGPGMLIGGAGQCPGQCPSSCAPSCQQSCCGGAGQQNPMMG